MIIAGTNRQFTRPVIPGGLHGKRILTIGDSTTEGLNSCQGNTGGYRRHLYSKLQAGGFTNTLFVGDQFTDYSAFGLPAAQCWHGGRGGQTVNGWLSVPFSAVWGFSIVAQSADIVLICLGTNSPTSTETDMRALLDQMIACAGFDKKWTRIGLAQPGPVSNPAVDSPQLAALIAAIPTIVTDYKAAGILIDVVPIKDYLTTLLLCDNKHWTDTGYDAFAQGWYDWMTNPASVVNQTTT